MARPNVLLVHCHDLGRYLGCYGADVETPRLDAFAEEGVLFEEHYVTAPQCSPSRASLMTGRHPHVNGMMGLAHGEWELGEDERVLPQYLGEAGYETHLFGLQHVARDTDRLGYDAVHSEGNLLPGVSPEVHQANRARRVGEVVSRFLASDVYETPIFAAVGFFECHRVERESGRFDFEPDHYGSDDPDEIRSLPYLPDRQGIRRDLAQMRHMVYAIDDGFGTILDALEDEGLAEETVVVFTTEHGIAFPRAKGSCYDPGIEAALLIRYPGEFDGGRRHDELLSNVDVLPTLLDLAGEDVPEAVAGRSFRPLVTDEEYDERECVFAEMTWHDMYNPVRAIRTRRHKYLRNFWHLPEVYLTKDVYASDAGRAVREEFGTPVRAYEELYDLEADRQEARNLASEPRAAEVRRDLAGRLREWMEATDDPLLEGPVAPADYDEMVSWPV